MRSLTLADALLERGATCRFICRDLPGHAADRVRAAGHRLVLLPAPTEALPAHATRYQRWLGVLPARDADETMAAIEADRSFSCDLLIVDSYALGIDWERKVGPRFGATLVLDDLPNRPHACDGLLDPNLSAPASPAGRTTGRYLRGPRYALLRGEFRRERPASLARRNGQPARQLLLTMGGADPIDASSFALEALRAVDWPDQVELNVAVGPANPRGAALEALCADRPAWHVLHDPADYCGLVRDSDLVLGAAGGGSWERCCLGCPALLVELEANQRAVGAPLHDSGAAWNLGPVGQVAPARFAAATLELAGDGPRLHAMSRQAADLVDGLGTGRVAETAFDLVRAHT